MSFSAVTMYSVELEKFSAGRHTGVGDVANRETTQACRDG